MHHKTIIFVAFLFIILLGISLFIVKTGAYFTGSQITTPAVFITQQWKPASTEFEVRRNDIHYSTDEKIGEWRHGSNVEVTAQGIELVPIDQEESSISQRITVSQAGYFSFLYQINTSESAVGFDKVLEVKFNDEVVFTGTLDTQGVWKQAGFDLTNYLGEELEISIISNNTFDNDFPPRVIIKNATTTKLFLNANDILSFIPSKEVGSISVEFSILIDGEIVEDTRELSYPYQLSFTQQLYPEKLSYYSTDLFGNVEGVKTVGIASQVNNTAEISNIELTAEKDRQMSMRLEVSNIDSQGAVITKISSQPFVTDEDWDSAQVLLPTNHRKYGSPHIIPTDGGIVSLLFDSVPEGTWHTAVAYLDIYGNFSQFVSAGLLTVE